ncbi:hypothetical protein DRE_00309 [Drechslerella stenobrocha 248]|uniref:Ubiquitin carboxyl-terminal hydrolase n=1 Tax=Drechslerella stenobrocha 248 TaxID=1043628 RepID=W7HTA9_9PEZI|nr:hypothetical protein DRE_00309 [Drechslerella stenobrocha 248]
MSYYAYYNPYIEKQQPHHREREYYYPPSSAALVWLTWVVDWVHERMTLAMSSTDSSRQLTIAYAAGASLAAITLIYVFGPTFFIDGARGAGGYGYGGYYGGVGGRKKQTVVGLYNPANDCFVNSVLQALAGCAELRGYLVRRILAQVELEEMEEAGVVKWRGRRPMLTRALKVMLDRLNERPLYRKTITTRDFIYELEKVFRSRISRNQQDAQEFLQIVTQTLAEEYEAQEKVRATAPKGWKRVRKVVEKEKVEDPAPKTEGDATPKTEGDATPKTEDDPTPKTEEGTKTEEGEGEGEAVETKEEEGASPPKKEEEEGFEVVQTTDADEAGVEEEEPEHVPLEVKAEDSESTEDNDEKEEKEKKGEEEERKIPEFGMPMEGKLESGIQCLACGFTPKPTGSNFVVLTLNVPQKSYATLDDCFNEHLSTEYIDDFQCAKCKLKKMIAVLEHKRDSTRDEKEAAELDRSIAALEESLATDPEKLPKDVTLPPANATVVKSRIAKHTYFAHCPEVLAIHLSRSIFDYYSRKNSCKVAFPEELQLGPLLARSRYKLLGLITHRGSHESGHYDRRQNSHPPPYSTPMVMPMGLPIVGMPTIVVDGTPVNASAVSLAEGAAVSTAPDEAGATGTAGTTATGTTGTTATATGATTNTNTNTTAKAVVTAAGTKAGKGAKGKKLKGAEGRWWRISDDSVKDVKTTDVLGLQKEVYLLFYEKEKQFPR